MQFVHISQSQERFSLKRQSSYFENIFNDPLFIMVTSLQVFHIKLEQIQGSGTCEQTGSAVS